MYNYDYGYEKGMDKISTCTCVCAGTHYNTCAHSTCTCAGTHYNTCTH